MLRSCWPQLTKVRTISNLLCLNILWKFLYMSEISLFFGVIPKDFILQNAAFLKNWLITLQKVQSSQQGVKDPYFLY